VISKASNFGDRSLVFNGVDIGFNARFHGNGLLQGGVSVGRTVTDNCQVVDSPQALLFCKITPTWGSGTQIKLSGFHPLPWGFQASAILQNLPGAVRTASLAATNAQVAPSLGRNLAGCPATGACTQTAIVPLFAPSTSFEDRLTQVDLRFTRKIPMGRARIQGMLDIYNALNARTVLGVNPTYGPAWLRPPPYWARGSSSSACSSTSEVQGA